VELADSKVMGADVNVSSGGSLIDVHDAYVRAARDGFVFMTAEGVESKLDCRDTRWTVPADNRVLDAGTILVDY
jgi:hypothetical protein